MLARPAVCCIRLDLKSRLESKYMLRTKGKQSTVMELASLLSEHVGGIRTSAVKIVQYVNPKQ